MMNVEELETEIGMAVELKEYYFKNREKSPFNDLLFQFWCGYEIGLCIASRKLKPSLTDSYYNMPYKEYYERCEMFYWSFALGLKKYDITLELIKMKVIEHYDKFYDVDKDKVDIELLSVVLGKYFNIFLSHNTLYKLRKLIEEIKG